jgi:poly-gamma-glutamate capsule biosynthesis protein CapA/YwtB (metallophosphatase superfamily)
MTGRGVDQILPHPGDPRLWESYLRDARAYVRLAEDEHGPIPRPTGFSWPWGDALATLDRVAPHVRLANLETSITRGIDVAAGKAVHYRMHPKNMPCLTEARLDACVLANNHVLDFGRQGLTDTLDSLRSAGIQAVGAGRDAGEAARPAMIPAMLGPAGPGEPGGAGSARVVVFAFATRSSGVPPAWAAGPDRPGIDFLPDLTEHTAERVTERMRQWRRPGDIVVASLHWGSNWGYHVSSDQVGFAHRLVEGGVDLVYGHSSHHPRPIEVHRGRLILYGCGDLIDDYEGITGHEHYRDDLRLLYFPSVDPGSGRLTALRMAPMRARRMRLEPAPPEDAEWLCAVLSRISRGFGAEVEPAQDGMLGLRPAPAVTW